MKVRILVGIVFALCINSGVYAEPVDTSNLLVVFDNRKDHAFYSVNLVAVAGWSANGKVAVFQPGYDSASPSWFILDTITDEIIEKGEDSSGGVDENGNLDETKHFSQLQEAMIRQGIAEKTGSIVKLPYTYPASLQPLNIEYGNIYLESDGTDIFAVRGAKRKKISHVNPSSGNAPEIDATYAIKSPYQDRMLIITQVRALHIEFDYSMYSFNYPGCHLTAGF